MSILTRQGCIIEELSKLYTDELTITPKTFYPDDEIRSFQIFERLQDNTFAVPRYWAQEKFNNVDTFVGKILNTPNLVFKGHLRSAIQVEASKISIEKLQKDGGGILCLPTGTGKTVIALHVACAIKVKTLIVVHKSFLMDQWINRIAQFVPSARIGKLQQKIIEVDKCDIVVAMLQSIAMHQYNPEVFDGFGFVILDEVHVVPAPVFSRALFKVCTPCMLGLSATPERKDGLSQVISLFIGPVFMRLQLTGKAEVKVIAVPLPCNFKFAHNRYERARTITRLCNNTERNNLLAQIIRDLVNIKQKKIIVLSERRAHCMGLKALLASKLVSCALYLGGMKEPELRKSEAEKVILATYAMAKEGLDIQDLDTLVLAIPRSDVVQACGRILHGKHRNPLIVDIVDQWSMGKAQFSKRKTYYIMSGFIIL